MNVSTVLDKLLELQNVEIEILRERNHLSQLKKRKRDLLKKQEEFRKRLFLLEDRINRVRAEIEDLKNFVLYKQDRLKGLQKQREHATSRKSFKEILRQIAKTEDEIIRANSELARLQVELDELVEESKTERKFLKEAIEKTEGELKETERSIKEQKERISELENKALSIRETLPDDVCREYENLKEKYNGLVFSDISSGVCEGCGMAYSSAEFASLLRELEPGRTRCPYCGRFVIKLR
ncbi:hypothetical protein [Desulfurobacterium sp.]|uniref:zinc ribbon domain-containing protein n=1 Tax=Desulfurobacterium sp. TaxID=2004706 RepID=UPI0026204146|nr:hypothetical protein [Desulfurobacterium sp.]